MKTGFSNDLHNDETETILAMHEQFLTSRVLHLIGTSNSQRVQEAFSYNGHRTA